MNQQGLLIVFSGPSGVGKDTVLKKLLENNNSIKLSISATTRKPRLEEVNGTDYFFLGKEEFLKFVNNNDMLEYAEYCGNFYGTPKKQVLEWLKEGIDVILEIEVQGGGKVIKENPNAVSIFLMPPTLEDLKSRLINRNTENKELVAKRLKFAQKEMSYCFNYDYILVNNSVDQCVNNIITILRAEKLKSYRYRNFIGGNINYE